MNNVVRLLCLDLHQNDLDQTTPVVLFDSKHDCHDAVCLYVYFCQKHFIIYRYILNSIKIIFRRLLHYLPKSMLFTGDWGWVYFYNVLFVSQWYWSIFKYFAKSHFWLAGLQYSGNKRGLNFVFECTHSVISRQNEKRNLHNIWQRGDFLLVAVLITVNWIEDLLT